MTHAPQQEEQKAMDWGALQSAITIQASRDAAHACKRGLSLVSETWMLCPNGWITRVHIVIGQEQSALLKSFQQARIEKVGVSGYGQSSLFALTHFICTFTLFLFFIDIDIV